MLRCAIYTRKSTDEGLEQEFNSLDAQREACEAYIKSQKHEGWKLLPQHYDDGGYSGGSMGRPALQKLLQEIEAGRIDIIVVYKVDRLTRALSDFARMVELFDKNKVSFVSVTQQFNTTTSMGRLTLNVLLSFAQFEREVTAERIRDKIAASKKKGIWMGSPPPLGYDVRDKKLVINQAEADTVRTLFNLYLDLGSVRALKEEADRRGIRTKHRPNTKNEGNKPISRGNLYAILNNPLYVSEVRHKDATYPGLHDAIVDRRTWIAVQECLEHNATNRRRPTNAKSSHLLTGLVFDETGDRLTPTYTNKKGRRYNYYVSQRLAEKGGRQEDGWRLPAHQLEAMTINAIKDLIGDQQRMTDVLKFGKLTTRDQSAIKQRAETLTTELDEAGKGNRDGVLGVMIQSITLAPRSLTILMNRSALVAVLTNNPTNTEKLDQTIAIDVPFEIRRRGAEAKMVFATDIRKDASPDQPMIHLIARARLWCDQLINGKFKSLVEIAEIEGVDPSEIGHTLKLAFLAPHIVEAIVAGDQPANLTANQLRQMSKLPAQWTRQYTALDFPKPLSAS
jgi:site-specific DNA recombinase